MTEKLNIKMLYDQIVVTANKVDAEKEGLELPEGVDPENMYSDTQEILALGSHAEEAGLKVGDKVAIKAQNFVRRTVDQDSIKDVTKEKYVTVLPLEIIKGHEIMVIGTRDIKYIDLD